MEGSESPEGPGHGLEASRSPSLSRVGAANKGCAGKWGTKRPLRSNGGITWRTEVTACAQDAIKLEVGKV